MELKETSLTEIPIDALTEILLRVPAESLHPLKCVCKSWYRLIHDDRFVKSHLELWRSERLIWPLKQFVFGRESRITFLTLNVENQAVKTHRSEFLLEDCLVAALPQLRMRVHTHFCANLTLLDSCDGLLLFWVTDRCSGRDRAGHLLVCNPITKTHKLLPQCDSFKMQKFRWKIIRNAALQQHEIVGIEHPHDITPAHAIRCFIFKLHQGEGQESTAWKELCTDIPRNCRFSHLEPPVVSVGRKVSWLINLLNDNAKVESALLSLDLSTECLMLARIPPEMPTSRHLTWFYSERAMCCCLRTPSSKDPELWVVKDFDQPIWLKHHVIRDPPKEFYPCGCWYGIYLEDEGKLVMKLCCKRVGFEYRMSSREWRRIAFLAEGSLNTDDGCNLLFPHVNSLLRCD